MTDSRVRSLGNIIADSLELSNGYADRLVKDVPAATFARLARFVRQDSEVVIESNHPAFIYGHLSLYAPRVLEQIGSSTQPIPASFQAVFSKDAICVDDPTATIYPPMDLVTSYFKSQHQNLVTALRQAPDAIFDQPNPAEGRMGELFPTLGSLHTFYCCGHMMMHLGQVSAWRRMQGLGSA